MIAKINIITEFKHVNVLISKHLKYTLKIYNIIQ